MAPSCHSFGTARSQLSTKTVCAMECSYQAESALPVHAHDYPQLTMVLRGGYWEQRSGTTMACKEGAVLFRPAGDSHSNRFSTEGAVCLNLLFRGEEFRRSTASPNSPRRLLPSAAVYRIRREIRVNDDLSPLVLEEVARVLYATLFEREGIRLDSDAPAWLERIRELVQDTFHRPPSLDQLAAQAGRHPVHVARAFHRHYGSTIGEFIRQRRLEVACYHLATTEMPVSVIAHESAFADHSHLSRTMRRLLGVQPSGFRKVSTLPKEREATS